MSQELRVVRCFQCLKYQVDIVKKAKKWICKVCGVKQSLTREFFRGTGKECRSVVQQLSSRNIEVERQEAEVAEMIVKNHCESPCLSNELGELIQSNVSNRLNFKTDTLPHEQKGSNCYEKSIFSSRFPSTDNEYFIERSSDDNNIGNNKTLNEFRSSNVYWGNYAQTGSVPLFNSRNRNKGSKFELSSLSEQPYPITNTDDTHKSVPTIPRCSTKPSSISQQRKRSAPTDVPFMNFGKRRIREASPSVSNVLSGSLHTIGNAKDSMLSESRSNNVDSKWTKFLTADDEPNDASNDNLFIF